MMFYRANFSVWKFNFDKRDSFIRCDLWTSGRELCSGFLTYFSRIEYYHSEKLLRHIWELLGNGGPSSVSNDLGSDQEWSTSFPHRELFLRGQWNSQICASCLIAETALSRASDLFRITRNKTNLEFTSYFQRILCKANCCTIRCWHEVNENGCAFNNILF